MLEVWSHSVISLIWRVNYMNDKDSKLGQSENGSRSELRRTSQPCIHRRWLNRASHFWAIPSDSNCAKVFQHLIKATNENKNFEPSFEQIIILHQYIWINLVLCKPDLTDRSAVSVEILVKTAAKLLSEKCITKMLDVELARLHNFRSFYFQCVVQMMSSSYRLFPAHEVLVAAVRKFVSLCF